MRINAGLVLLSVSLALLGCARESENSSFAVMQNVMTVESWVSAYQVNRARRLSENPEQEIPVYPTLDDLKKTLLEQKQISSLEQSPLVNPVTKLPEWPEEEQRPVKNYRALIDDRQSVIGKGKVQFIPFVGDGDIIAGYLIRAGDPETGKVLCGENGQAYTRSSP